MLLIAFASTEGQTRKIAERAAAVASKLGQKVELYDTNGLEDLPAVDTFDAVIIAASVHEDCHQESAVDFVMAHRDQLRRKNSALISVSLSAATADGQQEAQNYAANFASATGWSPRRTLLLGGALDWPDCDYFQRQVLTQILVNCGLTPDQKGRHEFTDWNALEKFVTDFVAASEPER